MSVYWLLIRQEGTGCDYSIACGEKFIQLKAQNEEDALAEAAKTWEYYGGDRENKIESIKILEVQKEIDLDIDGLVSKAKEAERKCQEKQKEAQEKAEYERLKKKFE
jgi:hypothetical protein